MTGRFPKKSPSRTRPARPRRGRERRAAAARRAAGRCRSPSGSSGFWSARTMPPGGGSMDWARARAANRQHGERERARASLTPFPHPDARGDSSASDPCTFPLPREERVGIRWTQRRHLFTLPPTGGEGISRFLGDAGRGGTSRGLPPAARPAPRQRPHAALGDQVDRALDRDVDGAGRAVHPAVGVEPLALGRLEVLPVPDGKTCRRGSGGSLALPALRGPAAATIRSSCRLGACGSGAGRARP